MFKGVFRWNAQNRASLWHPAFFPNTSKHYFKLEKLLLLYYLLDGFVPALRNLKRWSPDALWEKQKTLKEKKTDKHIDKTWYGCYGKAVLTSKTTLVCLASYSRKALYRKTLQNQCEGQVDGRCTFNTSLALWKSKLFRHTSGGKHIFKVSDVTCPVFTLSEEKLTWALKA